MPTRPFSVVSAVREIAPGRFAADIDPEWTILGKPNGGYLLAILGRAATAAASHPHPLAASAHYLRAPDPGSAEVQVESLRIGRSASQLRARLVQNGVPCIEALFTVGTVATGPDVAWTRLPPPALASWEESVRIPATTPLGAPVPIMDQVDARLDPAVTGFVRDRPSGAGELRGWLELLGEPADVYSLLYAVDAFPPASFEVAPSGWVPTLELTAYVRALPAAGPLRMLQRAQVIADERIDEVCYVWDSTDRLVAQCTQLAGIRLLTEPAG